jgi:ACS family sodium-dependent inorganic phosphate cotransporter
MVVSVAAGSLPRCAPLCSAAARDLLPRRPHTPAPAPRTAAARMRAQVLGCDILKSGIFSVLPWMTMAVSANVGGWIADSLVARGRSVTFVRKLMQTLGFLGPAFCLTQLQHVSTLPGAVACMMGAQGFDAFSQSGLYSNHQDIGPRYAGVLLGLSNTAGVLAGVLGSLATGYILAHGTWSDVWMVAVSLYLVGTVVWNLFATGERIFD